MLAAWHQQAKVSAWKKWGGGGRGQGEGGSRVFFVVVIFLFLLTTVFQFQVLNTWKEVRENQMKELEERKKLLFFSLFSRSSWKFMSGSFSASLEGQPRDWLQFWGCLCKVGFLLQCIQSEVLHIWTGTVNTDANTVWGARKCLLIFVGKKKSILFTYCI